MDHLGNIQSKHCSDIHIMVVYKAQYTVNLTQFSPVYLSRRSDIRVDDMVEVFMNSIQQPEEELLGIVLGVTLELKGTLRDHVLQHDKQDKQMINDLNGLLLKQK